MADLNPVALWRHMLAASNESRGKTLFMAVVVSGVSALAVSTAAVFLGPLAEANRAAEREARLAAMMDQLPGLAEILAASGAESMEALVVNLATDSVAEDIDPDAFDGTSPSATALSPEEDIAGIGERPDYVRLYVLESDGVPQLVVFPIFGQGYTSTIKGFLALEGDMETVAALTITEQGETPGLGANIENASWQALWPGTSLVDADGNLAIEVVQGGGSQPWQVDGITGATRTGNGITNIVRFWVGPEGFGPILDKLKAGEI